METYQPIYDAVRSRMSNCDVGSSIHDAIRSIGLDHITHLATCALQEVSAEYTRPFITMKPDMSVDVNQYCFLHGPNLQEGVAGFGDTPEKAALNFDHNFYNDDVSKVIKK